MLTVQLLIADRLKTISCSLLSSPSPSFSRRMEILSGVSAARLLEPPFVSGKTVGSVSAGMLDFIPLPRILAGLLARDDSRYTSAKARDRYPFLPLILDRKPRRSLSFRLPNVAAFLMSRFLSLSLYFPCLSPSLPPGSRKLLPILPTVCSLSP